MPTISPLTTALLIVLAVGFAGAFIAYTRDRSRFRGYQAIAADTVRLARSVKGTVFRDGADLVVSGSWQKFPVQVRFSTAENTPGLDIRFGAPSAFTLSVMPGRSPDVPGRVTIRTPDERFNARFAVRSDHPTHARLFLGSRGVMECLQSLCRSPQTFVLISHGQIEMGQLSLPDGHTAQNAFGYLNTLGQLATALRSMPGSDTVKVERLPAPRPWIGRVALAVGVVVVLGVLVMAAKPRLTERVVVRPAAPEGIREADAPKIPGLARWRVANTSDYDTVALAWMRLNNVAPEARIEGEFCDGAPGVAYFLMSVDQKRRVVVLCNGENVYDTTLPSIGMLVRIPRYVTPAVKWAAAPTAPPDGDLLLFTRTSAPDSAVALFVRDHRIFTGVPADYQSLKLD